MPILGDTFTTPPRPRTSTPPARMRKRRGPGSAVRWGLAATAGATVFAGSYGLQRLWSLFGGEPSFSEVVLQGTTPFYWRCGMALLHAVLVGVVLGLAVDDDRAEAVLRWAPIWMPLVVLPLALAMVGFP